MPNAKRDTLALKQTQIKSNQMFNGLLFSCNFSVLDLVMKVPAV